MTLADTSGAKELKIVLPMRLATALRANKILTGASIAGTVEAALRAYYARAATAHPSAPMLPLEDDRSQGE